MPAKKKRHKPEFKAQVALEAYRGDKTINQLACEHEVAAVQVSQRKRQLLRGVPEVFVNASLRCPVFAGNFEQRDPVKFRLSTVIPAEAGIHAAWQSVTAFIMGTAAAGRRIHRRFSA